MEFPKLQITTRIAGVVVLYQSPPSCLESIKTYLYQLEKLYIIDNSPNAVKWVDDVLKKQSHIEYIHLSNNPGIATALNVAARKAINEGFSFLLTMDDDSQTAADLISQMREFLDINDVSKMGVLTPRHALTTAQSGNSTPERMEPKQVLTTMTSGNLVNLAIFQKVGFFRDDFFIDVVDHEYYLRLKSYGYQVVELPWIQLTHRLGHQKSRLGLNFVSHNPLRNYYLVRNSIFVAKLYRRVVPSYQLYALKIVLIEMGKAALLEDKSIERLRYIWKGICDGFKTRLGKLT